MKKIGYIFTLLFFVIFELSLVGCKKYKSQLREGVYSGNFTVEYSSETYTSSTTLIINDNNFSSISTEPNFSSRGSGTYAIHDDVVTFNDENLWLANFDWGLILSGDYDYTYQGGLLTLSKTNPVGRYLYKLKKK